VVSEQLAVAWSVEQLAVNSGQWAVDSGQWTVDSWPILNYWFWHSGFWTRMCEPSLRLSYRNPKKLMSKWLFLVLSSVSSGIALGICSRTGKLRMNSKEVNMVSVSEQFAVNFWIMDNLTSGLFKCMCDFSPIAIGSPKKRLMSEDDLFCRLRSRVNWTLII